MQNDVGLLTSGLAGGQVSDVTLDELKAAPLAGGDEGFDLGEVTPMPGRKVIEPGNVLVHAQQGLDEVGSNESGGPGDEPAAGCLSQLGFRSLDCGRV